MTLLPTGWIKMPGDNDETKRFAWSHVKSIFYNKAANVLLKDKLDEMDKIIDEKIAKALMSNVQVNDQSKIPTSALAYAMQQSITKNGQDIAKLNSDLSVSQGLFTDVADIVSDSNLYYAKIGPHLIYITGWLEIATGNYDASYQVFKMDEYKAEINTILHAVDANALTSPIFPMYINNGTNIVNLKLKQAINTKLTLQITGFVVV